MGYTTEFEGSFSLDKVLTDEQFKYINNFSASRRMVRDVNKLMEKYLGKFGLKETGSPEEIYGVEGGYFIGDGTNYNWPFDKDMTVIDYNKPPNGQPGLWCQWIVETIDNEQHLLWDGGEKFYNYVHWLKYLIDNFFKPWGITLNGSVTWSGEDDEDIGKITVKDNEISIFRGEINYV